MSPEPRAGAARWPKALMGLGVAALVLGVAEGITRGLHGPPPPPVVVLSGPSMAAGWLGVDGDTIVPVYMTDEAYGARFSVQSDTPRVVFLGGSTVHGGSALPLASEFPSIVGERLGVSTLNLAWPGMDSFEILDLFEDLVALDPAPRMDAVVITTGHNDYGNLYFTQRFADYSGGLRAHTRALFEHSAVYVSMRRTLLHSAPLTAPVGGMASGDPNFAVSPAARDTASRYLEANLRRLVWRAEQANIPVVLVVPGSNDRLAPVGMACPALPCARAAYEAGEFTTARDLDPVPLRAPTQGRERVRTVARGLDLPMIDAEALLTDPAQFIDHVHLSAAGHQALGVAVADTLRSTVLSE